MGEVGCKCEIGQGIEQNEFDISHYCIEDSEKCFAQVIGCIENIIISDNFLQVQKKFLDKYYMEFSEDEENRLVYMDIFKSYLTTVEKYIEHELLESISGFDMKHFEQELETRSNELDGEIFEMLSTFWDFNNFKRMFLEYKKMKEGQVVDFSQDIIVTKYNLNNV